MTRSWWLAAPLLVVMAASDSAADRCGCESPAANKPGFAPAAAISYTVGPSPDGAPFPRAWHVCVHRAFNGWTRANHRTGLNVRFVPGEGGIVVRFDKAGGLVIPERRAGGWTEPVRSTDGFLTQANIWLSADQRLLDSCEGLTKTLLHELGHLHGLADRETSPGRSVMNRVAGKNDRGGSIPIAPTMCDAEQARRASTASHVHALQCGVTPRTGDR